MEHSQIRIGSDGELIEPISVLPGKSKRKKRGLAPGSVAIRVCRLTILGLASTLVVWFCFMLATGVLDPNQFTWYRQLCVGTLGKGKLAYVGRPYGTYLTDSAGTRSCFLTNINSFDSSWMPDGKQITYHVPGGIDGAVVGIINANGMGEHTLARSTSTSGAITIPHGNDIVFFADDGGVYSVNADSGSITSLYLGAGVKGAIPSPDGKQVAIYTDNHLFTVDPNGSNLRQLLDFGTEYRLVVWSADSKSLAFHAVDESGQDGLYTIALDGLIPRQILSNLNQTINRFIWSPSSKQIIFLKSGRIGIVTLDEPKVEYELNVDADHISWSPDGTKLLCDTRGDYSQIYLVDPITYQTRRLTNQGWRNTQPTFSPDGKTIAYISETKGVQNIYVMDIDGTNIHQVTYDDNAGEIIGWQPQ